MGAFGVTLVAASTAPMRGRCCSSTRRLGGNVYLPRGRTLGVTPGERHVPLSATPLHISSAIPRRFVVTNSSDAPEWMSSVVASEITWAVWSRERRGPGLAQANRGRADTQAALDHNGRTISERHHRSPQRRGTRVRGIPHRSAGCRPRRCCATVFWPGCRRPFQAAGLRLAAARPRARYLRDWTDAEGGARRRDPGADRWRSLHWRSQR